MLPGTAEAGRGAGAAPARAEDQLHRRADDGAGHPRRLRAEPEAGGARARRQVGEHRVPRRRPRLGGVHRRRVGPRHARRTGVRARPPASSCTTASTTNWRQRSSSSRATSPSATRSTPPPPWDRWSAGRRRNASSAMIERAQTDGSAKLLARRRSPRTVTWPTASTSSRPCSATSHRTASSARSRCSARCCR